MANLDAIMKALVRAKAMGRQQEAVRRLLGDFPEAAAIPPAEWARVSSGGPRAFMMLTPEESRRLSGTRDRPTKNLTIPSGSLLYSPESDALQWMSPLESYRRWSTAQQSGMGYYPHVMEPSRSLTVPKDLPFEEYLKRRYDESRYTPSWGDTALDADWLWKKLLIGPRGSMKLDPDRVYRAAGGRVVRK